MSVQPDPATVAGTPSVNDAVAGAADDADKHTPPPPVTPPPSNEPNPTDGDGEKDDLRSIVGNLAQTVATLSEQVTKIANPDVSPNKRVPWTHRGGRHSE